MHLCLKLLGSVSSLCFSLHAYILTCLCIVHYLLQAGPLIKVKIPKNNEGNSKQFAFVNFKHEVSVPYSMHLLSGIRLYGRQLNLQYRAGRELHVAWLYKGQFLRVWMFLCCGRVTGSSHINQEGKSPANSQNPSPVNTPLTHRGARYPSQNTRGHIKQHFATLTLALIFIWCVTCRYDKAPDQMSSPSYSPPQSSQRTFSSPESLQKQAMVKRCQA